MMSDVDHSLLMALRDFIRPIVYEAVREVVREELANRPTPANEAAEYLSIKKASLRFDIPEGTLRNWIKRGQLPKYKIHGSIRLKVSEIENLLVKS